METDKIIEIVNYFKKRKAINFEQEESIRQVFRDETKYKLWAEDGDNDCGFSEEYVFWLEQKLIKYLSDLTPLN